MKNVMIVMVAFLIGGLILSCSSGSKGKKTEQELYTNAQNLSEKGDYLSAIRTYEEILKTYPDSPRAYKAQFLIAFVYSENLKAYDKARENYKKLLEKYPNCDLVDDAQYMLKTMETDSLPVIPDTGSGASD
ncbi:MAG: tetratricopeptide repeat protein [Candidatus Zixiibacteriota bacterium]